MYDESIFKVYFDCKFVDLHKNNELLSVGLVSEDNKMFYAERNDISIDDWVKEDIADTLIFKDTNTEHLLNSDVHLLKNNIQVIGILLNKWLLNIKPANKMIRFYCDCGYYGIVLLMDLLKNNLSYASYTDSEGLHRYTNISEYVTDTPIDLRIVLSMHNLDSDCSRTDIFIKLSADKIARFVSTLKSVQEIIDSKNVNYQKLPIQCNALVDALQIKYIFEYLINDNNS